MKLEGHIYCDGPDCETNAHVGPDRFTEDGRLTSLPFGFQRLSDWSAKGQHDLAFCSTDCLMKWGATFPPPEIIPLHDDDPEAPHDR